MIHVGIDLGTTFSKIGHVGITNTPALFPDYHDSNSFQTPSVVHIHSEGCLVGQTVEALLEETPDLPVVRFVKLKMGSNEPVTADDLGRSWTPQAVSALILKKLKADAEHYAHEDVGSAVITVPAQFGHAARRATRDAGRLAGISVSQIIDEPVAAATYYGVTSAAQEQTIFVYDLGGGTFDATVLTVSGEGLSVKATEGSNEIGGKWFDDVLIRTALHEFRRQHGMDLTGDQKAEAILRRSAGEMKMKLCLPKISVVEKMLAVAGRTCEMKVTRTQFEKLISPLVDRTVEVSERCLSGAGLTWKNIDKVLVVGGSSLVPLVRERIQKHSGKDGAFFVLQQPHQAISFGAAILADRAASASGTGNPLLVQQIASYHLGMRTKDPRTGKLQVTPLIRRNTPLPAEARLTVFTNRENQPRVILEVVQTKEADGPVSSLGHFAFNLESPPKSYPIEVKIAYDSQGIVRVTARDGLTGREMEKVMIEGQDNASSQMYHTDMQLVQDAVISR